VNFEYYSDRFSARQYLYNDYLSLKPLDHRLADTLLLHYMCDGDSSLAYLLGARKLTSDSEDAKDNDNDKDSSWLLP